MSKFVLTQALCHDGMEMLNENKADIFIADNPDPNNYLEEMKDTDAIIVRIAKCDANTISKSPSLKVIGRTGVGFDSVDVKKATEEGIPVVITPGANSRSVAEHTLAFILSLAKNLYEYQNEMIKGNWNVRDTRKAIEIEGKTVGIVGLGNIGKIVGELCRAIGMKTIAYDPILDKEKIEGAGCFYCESLDSLLELSDFVTVHVPLLKSTENLIDLEQLRKMKRSAYLINNSRGGIVNENALVEALNNGIIAGAALDAFTEEPPSYSNPLYTSPNLLLSPHSAAQTKEAVIKMAKMCVQGCLAVLDGIKWPYVADLNVYKHPKWKNGKEAVL